MNLLIDRSFEHIENNIYIEDVRGFKIDPSDFDTEIFFTDFSFPVVKSNLVISKHKYKFNK